MMKKVMNNVFWIGMIDWEIKTFHGHEYSTNHGSTYNSYLIEEEKTVLIDTVWRPFAKEYVDNLAREIDLKNIDYIVVNHGEEDHSGALPELMKHIPNTPIYCTSNAVKSLKGQYHQDWNFQVVKTGDALDIGHGKKLVFVEMKMLHWPDSMATYLTSDNILFSNDAFGQHYATTRLFNDLVDSCELEQEAIKYFANILTPFSSVLRKKLDEVLSLGLDIDMIATSHGVIWRDNPMQIVEKYAQWSNEYQENQITIVYDTMSRGTKKLAEKIAEGIGLEDPSVNTKVFNLPVSDVNEVITEIFKSKTVVVGSATVLNTVLHSIASLIHLMTQLKFKNKKAASFGCYGWSGEGNQVLNNMLHDAGFEMVDDGFKNQWSPDEDQQRAAIEYGKKIARA